MMAPLTGTVDRVHGGGRSHHNLTFAILIVVLLFKPSGLFGEKRPAAGL